MKTEKSKTLDDNRLGFTFLMYAITDKIEMKGDIDWPEFYKNNKKVIHVISHNSPYSWLASAGAMVYNFILHGEKHRKVRGVFHKMLYKMPFFSLLGDLCGTAPETFDSLVQKLGTGELTDVGVYPEGGNCFFGNGLDIQTFKSPRFIELALKTQSTILLYTVSGPEAWCKPIPVSDQAKQLLSRFLPPKANQVLENMSHFAMPILPSRLESLVLNCKVYHPQIKFEDLNSDPSIRKQQLKREANSIREVMKQMLKEQTQFGSSNVFPLHRSAA